jgi:ZIP family zinc transporter
LQYYYYFLYSKISEKLNEKQMLLALILTIIAGLATTVGGFLSFFIRKYNLKVLAIGLGFSAGAMIYISLVELLKQADETVSLIVNPVYSNLIVTVTFLSGILLSAMIDYLLPNHFEIKEIINKDGTKKQRTGKQHKLWRVGFFTFLIISIHNFPEGITTFSSTMIDVSLGLSVALAIAIHNIPEGISIALPIYYATGSKTKAILYSFLSGMAEVLGGLIGYGFIDVIFHGVGFGILIAITAGFMVYISFDELLPTAREYGKNHLSVIGVIAGMLVMSFSLSLLDLAGGI